MRYSLLGWIIIVAGCSGTAASTRWEASVDTVGDTISVRTISGSVWPGEMELVPEMSIGEVEGEDAYMLGSVRGLAVTSAGEIYALDGQVPVLRKYGADGRHLLDIGRKGGGPGEYNRPDGGPALLPDGRVLVRDPGNARIAVFQPDGTAAGDWRLPSGGGFSTSRKIYVDTAGNTYTPLLLERDRPVTEWKWGLARIASDGTHGDTLPAPTWDYDPPTVSGRSENSSSSSNVPFSPSTHWALSPLGYLAGAVSTDYRIELYRRSEPVLRIERTWESVPVLAAEKSEAEERITNNMRDNFPGWRWNGPPVPDTKPPFRSFMFGDDGRIWVLLSQPSIEIMSELEAKQEFERTQRTPPRFREPVVFDVFEPDGRYLGRVRAPDGFATYPEPVFRGDFVWAVARDSLDVAHIVRYRLRRVSASAGERITA